MHLFPHYLPPPQYPVLTYPNILPQLPVMVPLPAKSGLHLHSLWLWLSFPSHLLLPPHQYPTWILATLKFYFIISWLSGLICWWSLPLKFLLPYFSPWASHPVLPSMKHFNSSQKQKGCFFPSFEPPSLSADSFLKTLIYLLHIK